MVFARNEVKPLQDRLLAINEWVGRRLLGLRSMGFYEPSASGASVNSTSTTPPSVDTTVFS